MTWRDPWPDEPPKARTLSAKQLEQLASGGSHALSKWEADFMRHMANRVRRGLKLSLKQAAVLDKNIIRQCWDNDPRLREGL